MPQPKGHNGPSPEKLRDEVTLSLVADDVGELEATQGALAEIARLCVHAHRRIGSMRDRHESLPERLAEARALEEARARDEGRASPDVRRRRRAAASVAGLVDAA